AEKMYEGFKEFFKESIEKERQEWRKEGRREGTDRANERVAVDMLKDKYPLTAITKISKLSENVIRNLAASRGLVIS
ncbi:MAG: hypothetical protein IJS40_04465, partial [Synergistaceae bacterium]|nr:hypothetical protein [Synergistaceae bacterium]